MPKSAMLSHPRAALSGMLTSPATPPSDADCVRFSGKVLMSKTSGVPQHNLAHWFV
jgi:hypothetical protein